MNRLSEEKINKIVKLRLKGNSIPEISNYLHIPKTTVFRYTNNIKIPNYYLSILLSKRGGSAKRKQELEQKSYEEGKKLVGLLSERDKMLFASALYWAEGNKKDLIITNTNPNIIKIFLETAKNVFKIDAKDICLSVRIYEDMDAEKSTSFWSNLTGIDKQVIRVNILSGKKIGKLQYGMCRLRIKKGGSLLKKINGINKAMTEVFQS